MNILCPTSLINCSSLWSGPLLNTLGLKVCFIWYLRIIIPATSYFLFACSFSIHLLSIHVSCSQPTVEVSPLIYSSNLCLWHQRPFMYIIVVLVEFGSTTLLFVFSFPYFSFLSSSFPAFFFFFGLFLLCWWLSWKLQYVSLFSSYWRTPCRTFFNVYLLWCMLLILCLSENVFIFAFIIEQSFCWVEISRTPDFF